MSRSGARDVAHGNGSGDEITKSLVKNLNLTHDGVVYLLSITNVNGETVVYRPSYKQIRLLAYQAATRWFYDENKVAAEWDAMWTPKFDLTDNELKS